MLSAYFPPSISVALSSPVARKVPPRSSPGLGDRAGRGSELLADFTALMGIKGIGKLWKALKMMGIYRGYIYICIYIYWDWYHGIDSYDIWVCLRMRESTLKIASLGGTWWCIHPHFWWIPYFQTNLDAEPRLGRNSQKTAYLEPKHS